MTEGKRAVTKKMDDVEQAVDDLQHEKGNVDADKRRRRNRSRASSSPRWVVVASLVAIIIGTFTFLGVLKVNKNTTAIRDKCQLGNDQVTSINTKLNQLNLLIDAAINNGDRPPSPEVAQAFDRLREPLPLKACD